jgi:hypothetical protein
LLAKPKNLQDNFPDISERNRGSKFTDFDRKFSEQKNLVDTINLYSMEVTGKAESIYFAIKCIPTSKTCQIIGNKLYNSL